MAYEMTDRSFPCRCGNGKIIAEWKEHDTWPSPNRYIYWSFACPHCEAKYKFYSLTRDVYVVRKGDAKKHMELVSKYESAMRRLRKASSRHEQDWVDRVLSLRTKAAMHRALAPTVTYATFLKNAKDKGWVEREARSSFQFSPQDHLDRMGIEDAEVSRLIRVAKVREKRANDYWESINKKPVPLGRRVCPACAH